MTVETEGQGQGLPPRWIAALGVGIISFSAIFVRLASASPSTAAFFRCLYALPILTLVWWRVRGRDRRPFNQRWLPFAAGIALGVDFFFWHKAIDLIGAGLSTVLGNTQVLFVGLAAWWLHRERPTRAVLAMVPVVFAGVVLVSGLGRPEAYGSDPLLGTFYGILTGLTYTVFLLAFRQAGQKGGTVTGPLLEATLGATLISLVLGLLFDPGFSLTPVWPQHGWLLALALGSQVIGWLFLSTALPRMPAIETSVLLLMQPVLTVLWAYLIFAERLSSTQWWGVALVIGGIGALSVGKSLVAEPD